MSQANHFFSSLIETKLGALYAISDDEKIYFLEFADRPDFRNILSHFIKSTHIILTTRKAAPIKAIQHELDLYFSGNLTSFKTPVFLTGTSFQKRVWHALLTIPFGETRSYLDIAKSIDQPTACRAVARANAANHMPILIPCHRVINANGQLGGYSGGLDKKSFLLGHEKSLYR